MHIKNKRGQSTVEYVLLVTAVVVVIIAFIGNNNSGFRKQLNSTLNTAGDSMSTIGDTLAASHGLAPAGVATPTPITVPVCDGAGQPACNNGGGAAGGGAAGDPAQKAPL